MSTLERAISIAHEAHAGQERFDGSPYVSHPLRVMKTVEAQGHSELTQIVAVLHDVPEDSAVWTIDCLRDEGYDDEVLIPLDLLTKNNGDSAHYARYIDRLAVNPRSRAVKKADLFDNMDLSGLDNPSRKRIEKIEKYGEALVRLSRFPLERI